MGKKNRSKQVNRILTNRKGELTAKEKKIIRLSASEKAAKKAKRK